jgi:hypothetical protein
MTSFSSLASRRRDKCIDIGAGYIEIFPYVRISRDLHVYQFVTGLLTLTRNSVNPSKDLVARIITEVFPTNPAAACAFSVAAPFAALPCAVNTHLIGTPSPIVTAGCLGGQSPRRKRKNPGHGQPQKPVRDVMDSAKYAGAR